MGHEKKQAAKMATLEKIFSLLIILMRSLLFRLTNEPHRKESIMMLVTMLNKSLIFVFQDLLLSIAHKFLKIKVEINLLRHSLRMLRGQYNTGMI
jgi:hypothetical protein